MIDRSDTDDKDFGPSLITDFQNLSAADKSVLIAAYERSGLDESKILEAAPDAPMMTTAPGSPNFRYWGKLAEVGWVLDVTERLPAELQAMARAFVLTNLGKISIVGVFRRVAESK